jgi:aminoglycoside 6'-N-acetyltransferase I
VDRAHHLGESVTRIDIVPATAADAHDWARLRHALWPHHEVGEHRDDAAALAGQPGRTPAFIAYADGIAAGFAEASLRTDYVNGCATSPVAFLEGIYVMPEHRRHGIASRLVRAVEDWACDAGCTEFASDADIANRESHALHRALGFSETQRVVYFHKLLKE